MIEVGWNADGTDFEIKSYDPDKVDIADVILLQAMLAAGRMCPEFVELVIDEFFKVTVYDLFDGGYITPKGKPTNNQTEDSLNNYGILVEVFEDKVRSFIKKTLKEREIEEK